MTFNQHLREPLKWLGIFAFTSILSACGLFYQPDLGSFLNPAVHSSLHPQPHSVSNTASRQLELQDVGFFPQTEFHCGPAALATLMQHRGLARTPEELAPQVYLPKREGSLQAEMLATARRQGLVATVIPGNLASLLQELANGQPVLILQNLGLSIYPRWHYAVVVGYDLDKQHMILRSGTVQRDIMPMYTFEKTWQRAGRWAVILTPPGQWPVTATADATRQAATGFERSNPAAQSLLVYRAATERWPHEMLFQFGLANQLHATGDIPGAISIFKKIAHEKNATIAWLNLANSYLDIGQINLAREAYERARGNADASRWEGEMKKLRDRIIQDE